MFLLVMVLVQVVELLGTYPPELDGIAGTIEARMRAKSW